MSVETAVSLAKCFLSSGFNVAQTTSLLFFIDEELVSHAVDSFESSGCVAAGARGLPSRHLS